jgi:predicted nucleic acid-binding Zn ribbon protein
MNQPKQRMVAVLWALVAVAIAVIVILMLGTSCVPRF